jgi:hypothetical protein
MFYREATRMNIVEVVYRGASMGSNSYDNGAGDVFTFSLTNQRQVLSISRHPNHLPKECKRSFVILTSHRRPALPSHVSPFSPLIKRRLTGTPRLPSHISQPPGNYSSPNSRYLHHATSTSDGAGRWPHIRFRFIGPAEPCKCPRTS